MPKLPPRRKGAVFVLRRDVLAAIATIAAIVLIFTFVNHPAVVGASGMARDLPVYSVARDNKAVSLTFDAVRGNEDTRQLIEILDRYNVRATFFVVGSWVDKYPESVKTLSGAGHEIMNHSDDRARFSKLSAPEIRKNITACNEKIAAVTGSVPTLFRAPYGEYDDNVIKAVRSLGMETIQWDVDSLDWKGLPAPEIIKRVTGKVRPGSIVLLHNAARNTPEALPAIIEYLLQNGYSIVPVSELLLAGDYTIDHTGRQVPG